MLRSPPAPALLSGLFCLNCSGGDSQPLLQGWGCFWGAPQAQPAGRRVEGRGSASPCCGKVVGFCKPGRAAGSGRAEPVYPGQGLRGLTRLLVCCLFEIPACRFRSALALSNLTERLLCFLMLSAITLLKYCSEITPLEDGGTSYPYFVTCAVPL